jgi:hypothetical protein
MALSPEELERYARHIVLREVGGQGQQKLRAARVLSIGAGGIGSPAILYLAAAGVGTLGIVDDDKVSLSNLQRQVLHATSHIGRPKTESASLAVSRLNPHVNVEVHEQRLTPGNAARIIKNYDIVLDGSDNFATRYLVSDTCFHQRKPLVTAALGSLRCHADHDPRARTGTGRQAEPDLSLPVSGAAAGRNGSRLRTGRNLGRDCGRRGDHGRGRGAPRDRRLWRESGRQVADDGPAQHAFRNAAL